MSVLSDRSAAHYRVMRQCAASNSVGKQIYEKALHPPVLSTARRDDLVHSPSRQVKGREGESCLVIEELKLYCSWSKSAVFQNVVGTV